MMPELIEFKEFIDERGGLVALEENKNIPFEIKRIYYIYKTPKDISRGFHAHKNLKQIAVCLSGSCNFLLDDGTSKSLFRMDNPNLGLYIENSVWREMSDFSEDCVLLVLASNLYDESDYIRDYQEFLEFVGAKK